MEGHRAMGSDEGARQELTAEMTLSDSAISHEMNARALQGYRSHINNMQINLVI